MPRRTERAASARRRERWENVEGLPCGADTKVTKDHEDTQRLSGKPPITQIEADLGRAGARLLFIARRLAHRALAARSCSS